MVKLKCPKCGKMEYDAFFSTISHHNKPEYWVCFDCIMKVQVIYSFIRLANKLRFFIEKLYKKMNYQRIYNA